MKSNKHFKWPSAKRAYLPWWESLTIDQKNVEKKLFEEKRQMNFKKRFPYPNMMDLTTLRLSQLTDRHISRIYDFKDVLVEDFIK